MQRRDFLKTAALSLGFPAALARRAVAGSPLPIVPCDVSGDLRHGWVAAKAGLEVAPGCPAIFRVALPDGAPFGVGDLSVWVDQNRPVESRHSLEFRWKREGEPLIWERIGWHGGYRYLAPLGDPIVFRPSEELVFGASADVPYLVNASVMGWELAEPPRKKTRAVF